MAFYLRYRSQTINELDSTAVREKLLLVLPKGEVHAFLFTGPKGLGKTSTARIIAKVVNCERNKLGNRVEGIGDAFESIEPCNQCGQCLSITNGTNMDVMEIDAASNRGIDEIRDLKEKIRLSPLSAKKKVYIIDEVHMLTTEAFNALLKTLEEPPAHAMFILCTTEAHKVPATILSRCFHINFAPATPEELVRAFKRIVAGEKLEIDDEALMTIASLSEGGFRDGTKILEELTALANGQKITKTLIEEKYHVASSMHYVTGMFDLLGQKNMQESLQLIAAVVNQGIDVRYFITQLLENLHEMLLQKVGAVKIAESKGQRAESQFTIEEIGLLVRLLNKAYGEMKFAVVVQLPLELAVIEYCMGRGQRAEGGEEEGNVSKVSKGEEKKVADDQRLETEDQTVSVASLQKKVNNMAKIKAMYGEEKKVVEEELGPKVMDVSLLHFSSDGPITKEWMNTFWQCIISTMKQHNHTIAGVLRGCTIQSFDRENLIIEAAYKFHKERLDQGKTMETLEKVCKELIGKKISVKVVLKT